MTKRILTHSALAIAFLSFSVLVQPGPVTRFAEAQPRTIAMPDEQPWVQVTSVTIEPAAIHKAQQPYTATITVQMIVRGQPPADATANIEVSTYSAEPPGNNVTYSKPQSVPLKENLIALKFTAEAGSKTVPGKVIVAASIDATTAGVRVKQPETDKEWRAELSTLYP